MENACTTPCLREDTPHVFFSSCHSDETLFLMHWHSWLPRTACTTRLWLTALACTLDLGPDGGSRPQRITWRICHLNIRGITLNLFDTAGGGGRGSQKGARPNPLEKTVFLLIGVKGEEEFSLEVLRQRLWQPWFIGVLSKWNSQSFGSSGALQHLKHLLTHATLLMDWEF